VGAVLCAIMEDHVEGNEREWLREEGLERFVEMYLRTKLSCTSPPSHLVKRIPEREYYTCMCERVCFRQLTACGEERKHQTTNSHRVCAWVVRVW
jgi:hypothetical protein